MFYEIDFQGAPGSILEGLSGTTQGIVRMEAFGLGTVPTSPSTWGKIKSLYSE